MKESSSGNDEIDRIDRRILQLLQRDGRMTNADLAQAVNVSPATCHRRTQRLFDDGQRPQAERVQRQLRGPRRPARRYLFVRRPEDAADRHRHGDLLHAGE